MEKTLDTRFKQSLDRYARQADGTTTIRLYNVRGDVTLAAKYPDNIELIELIAAKLQTHNTADIINHLQKL